MEDIIMPNVTMRSKPKHMYHIRTLFFQDTVSERNLLYKYTELASTPEWSAYLSAMNVEYLSESHIKNLFCDLVRNKGLPFLVRRFEQDGFLVMQDDTMNFLVYTGKDKENRTFLTWWGRQSDMGENKE